MNEHLRRCVISHVRALAVAAAFCLPALGADIQGTVLAASGERPLIRAEVVLRPVKAGTTALGVTTDENGRFAFVGVAQGQYTLVASRSGFLSSGTVYQNQARMLATFPVKSDITGLIIRLQPAATIAGKVRHQDGEAAAGLLVQAHREVYERRRHSYEVAARGVTDDRGEYRLYGLPPGRYHVSAIYVGYAGADDVADQLVRDAYGQLVTPERTVTTFAPSSYKFTEAIPVVVTPGAMVGTTDIFLARARTATVKGRVLSGSSGLPADGATVSFLREDAAGSGSIPYPTALRMLPGAQFEIRGVVPGRYVLEARQSRGKGEMSYSRQSVVVGNAPEVTANVLLLPEVTLMGTALTPSREEGMPAGLRIVAEPRGGGAIRTAAFAGPNNFGLRLTAGETYDLLVESREGNTFLASARLNDVDLLAEGLRLESSGSANMLVRVSQKGAAIEGATKAGANILLMPGDGSLARHSETTANEWGLFAFSGVAPGDYRILAWFDQPPCEVWSPSANTECAQFGIAVSVTGSNSYTVVVQP